MPENETVNENTTNEEEIVEVEEETVEEAQEVETTEDTEADDRDEEIAKLRKENHTLKIQKGKKAEKDAKVSQEAPVTGDMSSDDMFALLNAKLTDKKDIADVKDWARTHEISVEKALESNIVQTVLADNKESRKVASATNTGSGRRGTSEVSGDDLLANARKGKMPETDAELDRMLEARYSPKRSK